MEPGFYRRGEMETALWHAFSRHGDGEKHVLPPPVFLNRIKRMLDLERELNETVFAVNDTDGRGYVAEYSTFSVFLMGLALTFLDNGLKQQDVLFLLVHIKYQLQEVYEQILENPPTLDHQVIAAEDRPGSPVQPDNPLLADTSAFLLINKVEMIECWPRGEEKDPPDRMIFGPIFCFGITELAAKLRGMGYQQPSYLVTEVADLAVLVRRHLGRDKLLAAMAAARARKQQNQRKTKRKFKRATK